jgi:hypothetical protein
VNKTQKLVTSMLASLTLATPGGPSAMTIQAEQGRTQQQDANDTKVAEDVFEWLVEYPISQAKSVDEIAKYFPQYDRATLERALKSDSRIKAATDTVSGTKKYYGKSASVRG